MKTFIKKLTWTFYVLILFCTYRLKAQEALIFSGGDHVSVPSLAFGNNWTAEAWVNPAVVGGGWYTIFAQDYWFQNSPVNGNGFAVAISGGSVFVNTPLPNDGYIVTNISANVWTHIAATYNNGIFAFYKNGILVGLDTAGFANASTSFVIGARHDNAFPATLVDYYHGKIDEVRIWNTTRSQCQIQQYMNCEIPTTSGNLVANYHFNQCTGIALFDLLSPSCGFLNDATGNGHTGTINSLINWTTSGHAAQGMTTPASASSSEINVVGNGNNIADGSTGPLISNHTNFNGAISRTFTIQNTGGQTLNVGTPVFTGSGASQFSITTAPATLLAAGTGTTSFVVTFTPTSLGVKTATLNIYNLDCDEPVYDFVITATATPAEALSLEGATDYAQASDPNLGTSDCTIETWFKQTSAAGGGYLMTTRSGEAGPGGNWWALGVGSGTAAGMAYMELAAAGGTYSVLASPVGSFPMNTWTHLAFTRVGKEINLYLNGILVARSTEAATRNFATGSNIFRFGGWPNFNGAWYVGLMDEARVWNTGHSQCEVQTYMSCEIPTTASNLQANYHFNQGLPSGTNTAVSFVIDETGAHNASLVNFALTGSSSNWVNGGAVVSGYSTTATPTVEIDVTGNGVPIADGTSATSPANFTDFNGALTRSFVINNTIAGGTLNAAPYMSGTQAGEFSVTTFPALSAAGISSTGFAVTFTPTTPGVKTATVNIHNSDCNESVYDFVVTATPPTADALNFDGVNDYIETNANITQLGQGDFTIETWIKTGANDIGILACQDGDAIWEPGEKNFLIENDGHLEFVGHGCDYIHAGGAVNDNNWHHVALVWDLQNGVNGVGRIYVDGIDKTASSTYTANTANQGTFKIGLPNYGESSFPFQGNMDEFRVWNVARTQCEIQTYMNCEIPGPMANLLLNYHFNQGSPALNNTGINTVTDASASPITGTLNLFALSGATSNWISPGAVVAGSTAVNTPTVEIDVRGNGNSIIDGNTGTSPIDFTDFNGVLTRTFTIHNTAAGVLNISTPYLSGTNANQFSITTLPAASIAGTGSTALVVTFTPASTGAKTATLNIPSNDCNEALYDFVIMATPPTAEALDLTGASNYVTVTGHTLNNQSFTIEFHAKRNNNATGDFIYAQGTSNTNDGLHIGFYDIGVGDLFIFDFWNNGLQVVHSDYLWHHWACVYNATVSSGPNRFIYRDGILAASDRYVGPYTGTGISYIGSTPWAPIANIFTGSLDDMRIWGVARSQCEIESYMNCEIPTTAPGLISNYHFNQGSPGINNAGITTLQDAAVPAYNGTLNGFNLTGTSSNWVTPGIVTSGSVTPAVITSSLQVKGNGVLIPAGSTATGTNNFTDFGTALSRTFTVENPGTGNLYINYGWLSGANAGDFSLSAVSQTLGTGATGSFVITFSPTALGTRSAMVTIYSSDCASPGYSFVITASSPTASALNFDGGNDFVSLPGAASVPTGNSPYTIEAWVKPNAFGNYGIIGWGNYGVNNQVNALRLDGAGYVLNYWWGNDLPVAAPTLTNGAWHHIAATYDGITRAIYIDGVLAGSDQPTGHSVPNNNNLKIGVTCTTVACSGGPEYFNGSMDEVRVWNVGRTQCQIQQFMNCEIPSTAGGLVVNYHFNQGIPSGSNTSVTSLIDAANAYNGTLNNFTRTGPTSNWVSPAGVANDFTTAVQPSATLALTGNGNNIPIGTTTGTNNFTDFSTNTSRTFVIQNPGVSPLYVNNLSFSGAGATNFSVTTQPSTMIAGSGSNNFVISFTPSSVGSQSAIVTINSSDCTSPNYSFVITASTSPASALSFDGIDDKITVPSGISFNNQSFTVEFWSKRTGAANNIVVGQGSSIGPNQSLHIGYRTAPGNEFAFAFYANDINFTTTAGSDGNYHHWACVYDNTVTSGSNRFLYLDGELVFHDRSVPFVGSGPLIIGDAGYGSNQFQGELDELRTWNVARSQCQIQTFMNCEIPGTVPGLTGNFHFNQGIPSGSNTAVTTLSNDIGANNGSLTGFGLTAPTSNWISPAHISNGFTTTAAPNVTVSVTGNSNPVVNGSTAPSTLNLTDFGTATSRTFVIQNGGPGVLNSVNLLITGPDASVFSVTTLPASTLSSGGSSSFVIAFTPTLLGAASATININTNDCSNNIYKFAITAAASPASALDFDGTDDQVEIPYTAALDNIITGNFSFEAWVKPTTYTYNTIFSKGDGSGLPGTGEYIFQLHTSGQLAFYHTAMNSWKYSSASVPLNVWSHVAVTYDGTHLKFYINGFLDATIPSSVALNTSGINSAYIGRQGFACNCNFFHGTIDEVRVWTVPRTQCEIITYMNCEIPTTAGGLLANYHFNQGIPSGANASYTLATDATGINTGTLTNLALTGSTSNWISPGGVISGSVTPAVPGATLVISGNSNSITPGSNVPLLSNFTDFGTASTRTFQVKNVGTGTLHLGNGLFSGANASSFTITTIPSTLLTSGASSSVVISFTPTSVGSHSAIFTVYSSDCSAPEYSFVITASATPADALNFDGIASYVDLGAGNALKPTAALTAEAWVYSSTWPGTDQTIFGNTENAGYGIFTRSTGDLEGLVRRNSVWGSATTPLSGISPGWHHVALTFDGRYTRLYLDGVMKSQDDAGATYPIDYIGNNTLIGGEASSGSFPLPGWYFNGSVDELRVWNTARTQCQIQTFMSCEIPNTPPGLVANYHFNQGIPSGSNTSVTSLIDGTGANTGTLNIFNLSGGSVANWISPSAVAANFTTGTVPAVSMSVTGNGNPIPNGSTITGTNNFTDFGSAPSRTFVIQNTGASTLYLNLPLSLSGGGASEFSISSMPASSIATGSTSFVVSFAPTSLGTKTAIVSINSSDCSAPNYSFVITATGTVGAALSLDGTNDEVLVPANAAFDFTAGTVEAWLNTPAINSNNCWASLRTGNSPTTTRWSLHYNETTNHIELYNGSSVGFVSTPLNPNTWYHVAAVISPSDAIVYVNGVYTGSFAVGINTLVTGQPLAIGNTNDPLTASEHFNGLIDELRIWNRPLCQAEIQNNMSCEISGTLTGLVANYHFNQGIASGANPTVLTLSDASGNSYNGTLSNFNLQGTSSNWISPGAVISGSSCSAFVAPEISVSSGTIVIPDGYATPTASNNTDFGNISASANIVRTYTIQNSGAANLSITSITLSGTGAPSFTIGALSPASPISAGNSAVFSVTFAPTSIGTKTAVINITNSDCDESIYDFAVSGNATAGESFVFDGSNDYINCGNILTPSYTKEAWVKIGASTNGNNFISAGSGINGTALWAPGIYNYSLSAGHNGAWNLVQDNTALSFGTWYHVAVTYDAPSTTMNLYKNGILVSSNSNVPPFIGPNPVHIGAFNATFVMNGAVDEVRIWSRPLCQSEIVNNMNCEIPTTASGLIANYHFNQGTGFGANATTSLVTDASGSASTGTLMNTVLSGTLSNWQSGGAVTTGSSCPLITVPEINVTGNALSITDGATLSTLSNHTDFGAICINTIMVRTYTIQNTGSANLTVSGITMSGANAALFTAGALSPPSPISPGSNAVFSVTFTPTSSGTKTAAINIANNDCNESPYDFVLTGTCNALPVVTANVTNSVICDGASTTLNGGGATTYTWTGGPPTVTNGIAFTPTATVTYTVKGTDALTGCTSTNLAVQTITVNPSPTITAISNSLVLCNGNSATITANGAGTNGTYTLNPGPLPLTGNTIVVSPALTTTYNVTGTSTNNCAGVNTVVVTITVNALPVVTATASNPVICNTATTSLIGGGADTYTWTGGTPTATNGVGFTPSATLSYTVAGTNTLTGCTSTNLAVQTITVDPTPTVIASAITSVICNGTNATLTASGAGTYTWNPGPLYGATVTPATATLTTYTVVGTSTAGCTSTNTAVQTISVNSLPTVTASISNSFVCAGSTVMVNGSGADTYTWNNGATDGVAFTPAASGSYSVTGTNTLTGCTSTNVAFVSLTVNALPSLTINATNSVICLGGQSTLSGSGASTYTWTSGVIDNVAFSPTATASYTLTGTDLNSCVNNAVVTITVNSLPALTVTGSPTLSCEAESTTLTISGASSYTWSTGEATAAIVITPTAISSYTIMAMDANTCTNTISYTQSVTPCPGTFTAYAIPQNISCRGKDDAKIRVYASSSYTDPVLSYLWNPAVLCPDNTCDSLRNLKPGTYNVTVKITYTVNGLLVKTDSLVLDPIVLFEAPTDCEVKVYNGITLNNDGVNDQLTIENIEEFPNNKVIIFNRWGQEIYSVSGYNNADKSWPLKSEAPGIITNTYFYIIDLGNGSSPMKGWIEVIRE